MMYQKNSFEMEDSWLYNKFIITKIYTLQEIDSILSSTL